MVTDLEILSAWKKTYNIEFDYHIDVLFNDLFTCNNTYNDLESNIYLLHSVYSNDQCTVDDAIGNGATCFRLASVLASIKGHYSIKLHPMFTIPESDLVDIACTLIISNNADTILRELDLKSLSDETLHKLAKNIVKSSDSSRYMWIIHTAKRIKKFIALEAYIIGDKYLLEYIWNYCNETDKLYINQHIEQYKIKTEHRNITIYCSCILMSIATLYAILC